jgi:hypothetical protein
MPNPVAAIDDTLARPQAGERVATFAPVAQQPGEHAGQQALAGERGQHADARDPAGRQARPAWHHGLEAERTDVGDAALAVPGGQRVVDVGTPA